MKKIAPDYYDDLPSYTSWCKVLWDFVFDPAIGPFARVRREFDLDGTVKEHVPNGNGNHATTSYESSAKISN